MKKTLNNESGQALIILLVITAIGLTIISAAAVFIFENMRASSITEQGVDAYYVTEAGIQEGLLRLVRNPSYTGTLPGQPLQVDSGSVVISASSVSGIITAIGTYSNTVRKIQVQTVYNNGVLNISSWKEVQ